jgi:hypothetical protein
MSIIKTYSEHITNHTNTLFNFNCSNKLFNEPHISSLLLSLVYIGIMSYNMCDNELPPLMSKKGMIYIVMLIMYNYEIIDVVCCLWMIDDYYQNYSCSKTSTGRILFSLNLLISFSIAPLGLILYCVAKVNLLQPYRIESFSYFKNKHRPIDELKDEIVYKPKR